MCGIAGIVAPDGVPAGALEAMGDAIEHRGPDGLGYLLYGPDSGLRLPEAAELPRDPGNARVGFAHRRLTIIDLSERSDQPMLNERGDLALLFNGEIYNYLELRRELEAQGHRFRSSGDTEVLLAAYERWGRDCVRRLVGMWAFAILDLRRDALVLSRDRFGIKPLFHCSSEGRFLFASELKALLGALPAAPEPDEAAVRRYLLSGQSDQSERTFFAGIDSVPAAHTLELPLETAVPQPPRRYWSIPPEGYDGSSREAARDFAEALRESVRVHARSDVPVGTCLSGGLDSSSIVCMAEEERRAGSIPSYTHRGFGYVPDDPEASERAYMEEVVRKTSIDLTYVEVSPERFQAILPQVVLQQDEPFGSTSIAAQWFVFEAARRAGIKVMLDGQGADEVLGGYHSYLPQIGSMQLREGRRLAYAASAAHQRVALGRWPLPGQLALHLAAPRWGPKLWPPGGGNGAPTPPVLELLSPELRSRCEPADYGAVQHDSVHDLLAANTASLGLPALLRFEDRNSMAHSIEARVPFLDHRLVELAFRLPAEQKVNGAVTKRILRRALKGVLPERIRRRNDKLGFRAEPSATWEFAARHRDSLLASRTPLEERWLNPGAIDRLLRGERSIESEFVAWRVINLKLWLRGVCAGLDDPLV